MAFRSSKELCLKSFGKASWCGLRTAASGETSWNELKLVGIPVIWKPRKIPFILETFLAFEKLLINLNHTGRRSFEFVLRNLSSNRTKSIGALTKIT